MKNLKISYFLFSALFFLSATAFSQPVDISAMTNAGNTSGYLMIGDIKGNADDANLKEWINLLSVGGPLVANTGQSRRRGSAVVEDVMLTMEYEKATPKLQEACAKGKVFPKVEIHTTSTYGGARAVYLKYELKNVQIVSYQTNFKNPRMPMARVQLKFQDYRIVK